MLLYCLRNTAVSYTHLDVYKRQVSMLIIDKGKMKLKDSGLPQIVIDNTPKYLRRSKVPVVKAKVGPRIMTLMCDAQIYPLICLLYTSNPLHAVCILLPSHLQQLLLQLFRFYQ